MEYESEQMRRLCKVLKAKNLISLEDIDYIVGEIGLEEWGTHFNQWNEQQKMEKAVERQELEDSLIDWRNVKCR